MKNKLEEMDVLGKESMVQADEMSSCRPPPPAPTE